MIELELPIPFVHDVDYVNFEHDTCGMAQQL